jgi:hypothetical protein
MLSIKFRFIWTSGFRVEEFLEINQSETRMACGRLAKRFQRRFFAK